MLRKTLREFSKDQCTDLAAALTYYAVLAIARPCWRSSRSSGLVGDPEKMVADVLKIASDVGVSSVDETLEPILTQLTEAPSAGFALVFGLVLALWSASGYVAAFSRGMNRVYEIDEGRPIWKLRPVLLVVTVVLVLIAVVIVAAVVLSGGVARSIGDAVGLSDVTVTVWNIVKWPVIVALVVVAIAVLYYATPNVQQPKFRWISLGAVVALVVWVLASRRLRLLRRQLRQLRRDLRLAGRRDRVPALAVDHQPRPAVRRGARRRGRARPAAAGRHRGREDHPAPAAGHACEREEAGQAGGGRAARPCPARRPAGPTTKDDDA